MSASRRYGGSKKTENSPRDMGVALKAGSTRPPSTWYWYASRSNEIFLDLDSRRAMSRAFQVLRRAIQTKKLNVADVWLYSTSTPSHAHLILVLKENLTMVEKVGWALWMGSDRIRSVYVLERWRQKVRCPDVLCTRRVYEFRPANFVCRCLAEKHKDKKVTDACPAMLALVGEHRSADYYPRDRDKKKRGALTVPWGRVSKRTIVNWRSQ